MSNTGFSLRGEISSWGGLVKIKYNTDSHRVMGFIGDGGEGKSSAVDAILAALTGEVSSSSINTKTGQAKAEHFLTFNGKEYHIKISKSLKSEVFTLTAPTSEESGGKEMLQKLVGNVRLDPFKLQSMKEKHQVEALKEVFNIDTELLDAETKKVRDQRTVANNTVKNFEGHILNHKSYSLDLEAKAERLKHEIPLGDLPIKRRAAIEHNLQVTRTETTLKSYRAEQAVRGQIISDLEIQIQALQKQLEKSKEIFQQTISNIDTVNEWLIDNPPVELNDLDKEIKIAEDHNREREDFIDFLDKHKDLEKAKVFAKRLDTVVKHRELWKRPFYIKSKMSAIPHMEILEKQYDENGKCIDDREGVTYLGRPLKVLSTTEIIKFSMLVRKAVNGKTIPVLILDNFEQVGTFGRNELEKLCKEEGYYAIVSEMKLKMPLQIVLSNTINYEAPTAYKKVYPVEKKPKLSA